jgi:hypothetical protein
LRKASTPFFSNCFAHRETRLPEHAQTGSRPPAVCAKDMEHLMKPDLTLERRIARFPGYRDVNGEFVPFASSDEVFRRARRLGARVLLRLELSPGGELQGLFYTNDRGLVG